MSELPPLLVRAGVVLSEAADRNVVIQLALECHEMMLQLAAADQHQAICHALAGARLFRALPYWDEQPTWVAIHEEQCCRYGAIWIHAHAREGNPLDPDWLAEALILLQRMQELHPSRVPWVDQISQELITFSQSSSKAAEYSSDLKIVVVGNCQSHPLSIGLRRAFPQARIHACRPVHMATADDVEQLHRRLASADLLVAQRVQPGYRDDIGLDTPNLRRRLPAGARALILPNLHFEGCHPWIGYARDPDQRLAQLESTSPLGAYHDFLAMAAAARDLGQDALLRRPAPSAVLDAVRSAHQQSLRALRERESECSVGISDWIEARVRSQPISHTFNHPTLASLDELLRRLLQVLDLPHSLGPELFDAHDYLGQLSIPVHPWVQEALALGAWSDHWGQRQGKQLPLPQQLEESLSFYRENPWIVAANAKHPKFVAAERCLDQLATAPMPPPRPVPSVTLLHLHGFKCAGSTLIWSLERATGGKLAYLESPVANQRLPWQRVRSHLGEAGEHPMAITSHLITLPPAGALALLCVAFLRDPWARILSSYRFERDVTKTLNGRSLEDYIAAFQKGPLCNYQTSQLSPQDLEADLDIRPGARGWSARPERIDLLRKDLFLGLVERYDESIVALEYQLEQFDLPLDLAYPGAVNTTAGIATEADQKPEDHHLRQQFLAAANLDVELHQQAGVRLDQQLAAIPNLEERLEQFRVRCQHLRTQAAGIRLRPYAEWTFLSS